MAITNRVPRFLQPERVPFTTIEIILAGVLLAPKPPTICAWCPTWRPTDPANHGASHTICDGCSAKLEGGAK